MPRWRFPDPSEEAARAAILAKIDAWWQAFVDQEKTLDAFFHRRASFDLPEFMHRTLHAIDERLCWEYGGALKSKGHRLVITPENQRQLRPLVQVILERAPRLPGWEFYAYRLPESAEEAVQMAQVRAKVDFSGTQVQISKSADSRINLKFHSPACRHPEDSRINSASFVAAETLLGEEILDNWIGAIDTVPLRKPGLAARILGSKREPELLTLDRVKADVDARIEATLAGLPSLPRYLIDTEGPDAPPWASVSLKPPELEDYPARSDLLVAITGHLQLWREAHVQGVFSSRRHTRFGETFCYLKIDGIGGLNEENFRDRGAIEDAIDSKLRPAEAGGTIGGGTGRRYSYIDLALTDVPAALPILKRVLREGDIPKRTWLLFFDDELAEEWVGIWDDTPAPPARKS